jgi:hypothetical protein
MTTNALPRWTRDQDYYKAPLDALDDYVPLKTAGIFVICGLKESVQIISGSDDIRKDVRLALADLKIRHPSFVSIDVCWKFAKSGVAGERAIEVDRLYKRFLPSA